MLKSLRLVRLLLILTWVLIPISAFYIKYQKDQAEYHLRYESLSLITELAQESQRKYSAEVLNKFNAMHPVRSGSDHAEREDTVPTPATFAIELSDSVSSDEITLRMFSQHPFKGREETAVPQDQIEREALAALLAGQDEYVYSTKERFLYAKPVIMSSQSCIDCHNTHPDSTFREWEIGDVRSVTVAEMKPPQSYMVYYYPVFFVVLLVVIATPIILLNRLSRLDYFKSQTFVDHLTGVYNRKYIDSEVKDAFHTALGRTPESKGVAVMILDIDHFKAVNDQHGHMIGDQCIQAVATRVRSRLLREKDVLARYGGEEFMVFIYNTSYDGAVELAEGIRAAVSIEPMSERELTVRASVGVCHVPGDGKTASFAEACRLADEALYDAKAAGRDRVICRRYDDASQR